ncbi:hypothetical protein EVAR_40444_1 [Eumeta japonica]|uniref:Uncharacterized protein n=1 Tax=Eumeta variegata TaxID=151549 RepID=A0A4C1WZY4_EUMVA|nr:hypothetical protein EVAR_40444_1 [Eumeta japonica]
MRISDFVVAMTTSVADGLRLKNSSVDPPLFKNEPHIVWFRPQLLFVCRSVNRVRQTARAHKVAPAQAGGGRL